MNSIKLRKTIISALFCAIFALSIGMALGSSLALNHKTLIIDNEGMAYQSARYDIASRLTISAVSMKNSDGATAKEKFDEMSEELATRFGEDFLGGQMRRYSLACKVGDAPYGLYSYNSKMFRSDSLVGLIEGSLIENYKGDKIPVYAPIESGFMLGQKVTIVAQSDFFSDDIRPETVSLECEIVGFIAKNFSVLYDHSNNANGFMIKDLENLVTADKEFFSESYKNAFLKFKKIAPGHTDKLNVKYSDDELDAINIIEKYAEFIPTEKATDLTMVFLFQSLSNIPLQTLLIEIAVVIALFCFILFYAKDKSSFIISLLMPIVLFIGGLITLLILKVGASLGIILISLAIYAIIAEIAAASIVTAKYFLIKKSNFSVKEIKTDDNVQ